MSPPFPLPFPAQLQERTQQATARARTSGALQPIATDLQVLTRDGVPFQVRVLGRAALKERARPPATATATAPTTEPARRSPFEDPEPDLVVGPLAPAHLCLLNKFPVVEQHLLVVTRAFEEQESALTEADFTALAACLGGLDGLAFYNAGRGAGASQRHKHLQLIPALGPPGRRAPLEVLLPTALSPGAVVEVPALPFRHALTGLSLAGEPPERAGAQLASAYRVLRSKLGFPGAEAPPYNLLATRDWMLLVPRSRAESGGVEVNAMGFAGSLLVRDAAGLAHVERLGPLAVLAEVGVPR